MATQAGPQMKRVVMDDGSVVLLPADAIVHPVIKTDADAKAALRRPLGGTWK